LNQEITSNGTDKIHAHSSVVSRLHAPAEALHRPLLPSLKAEHDAIADKLAIESIMGAIRLEMQITRQADNVLSCVASVAVREILRSAAISG